MAKIVKITEETVLVGMDDGNIVKVRKNELGFEPKIGDKVEIFQSSDEIIVSKAEENQNQIEKANNSISQKEGINIVINNQSNNSSTRSRLAPQTNGEKVVNKLVYVLLAIFLGHFGAHKFYAGKRELGFSIYVLLDFRSINLGFD